MVWNLDPSITNSPQPTLVSQDYGIFSLGGEPCFSHVLKTMPLLL